MWSILQNTSRRADSDSTRPEIMSLKLKEAIQLQATTSPSTNGWTGKVENSEKLCQFSPKLRLVLLNSTTPLRLSTTTLSRSGINWRMRLGTRRLTRWCLSSLTKWTLKAFWPTTMLGINGRCTLRARLTCSVISVLYLACPVQLLIMWVRELPSEITSSSEWRVLKPWLTGSQQP
jgi:hypothetical protein